MKPRLVSEADAAAYVGLDVAAFSARVAAGTLPAPLPDFGLYDLRAIDAALDDLSAQRSEDAETLRADAPLDDYSPQNVFLVPHELAERWGIDVTTLANLRARGEGVPYTKPTGTVLYRLSDVLEAERVAKITVGQLGFRWSALHDSLKSFAGLSLAGRLDLLRHCKKTMR